MIEHVTYGCPGAFENTSCSWVVHSVSSWRSLLLLGTKLLLGYQERGRSQEMDGESLLLAA